METESVIGLLQRAGLSKYEAEAYTALLQAGSLTGYEVGKRSAVPLSRSYEILERLVQQGLAVVQPGDPPRYAAEPWQQFLERLRRATTSTVEQLAVALSALSAPDVAAEYWIVRGAGPIVARAVAMIDATSITLDVAGGSGPLAQLETALRRARSRSGRIRLGTLDPANDDPLVVLADGQKAIVGTLRPAHHCQAALSSHAVFLDVVQTYLEHTFAAQAWPAGRSANVPAPLNWVAWEDEKQRQLRGRAIDRVA